MKFVLTGATGLLGNNIARIAVAAGHEVVCPVRKLGDRSLDGVPVTQVQIEFDTPRSRSNAGKASMPPTKWTPSPWDELLSNCDAVIHSAALIHIGWQRQEESWGANVELTNQIAAAARNANCRMVHISTVDTLGYSVDGRQVAEGVRRPAKPASAYVRSKSAAEQVVQQWVAQGLNAVVIHPGFMVGPWDWKPSSGKMIWAVAKRQIPMAPGGGCSVADVRNVAQAVVNAVTRGAPGEHYILGGHNLRYTELFREIAAVTGTRPPRWRVGPVVAVVAGWIGDCWTRLRGHETDLNSALVRMGQLRHFYSSEKAVQELGYEVGPLRPAIEAAWKFLREHAVPERP